MSVFRVSTLRTKPRDTKRIFLTQDSIFLIIKRFSDNVFIPQDLCDIIYKQLCTPIFIANGNLQISKTYLDMSIDGHSTASTITKPVLNFDGGYYAHNLVNKDMLQKMNTRNNMLSIKLQFHETIFNKPLMIMGIYVLDNKNIKKTSLFKFHTLKHDQYSGLNAKEDLYNFKVGFLRICDNFGFISLEGGSVLIHKKSTRYSSNLIHNTALKGYNILSHGIAPTTGNSMITCSIFHVNDSEIGTQFRREDGVLNSLDICENYEVKYDSAIGFVFQAIGGYHQDFKANVSIACVETQQTKEISQWICQKNKKIKKYNVYS